MCRRLRCAALYRASLRYGYSSRCFSSLSQSDPTFEQQATHLVDDRRAAHHPTLAHPVQGLQIQLVIALDRYEAHPRPPDRLRDRLGVDVVTLVGPHVGLHVLGRHQSHLMPLLSQGPAKKMCTPTGFHANQLDAAVAGEVQQLCSGELLAHHNFATQVEPTK